ncbi:hypothetical protein KW798_00150 [Candidatus Parcubacteria bacterium]|nr:hypothetical protein [Candidatus Parcubacteria bacterium]
MRKGIDFAKVARWFKYQNQFNQLPKIAPYDPNTPKKVGQQQQQTETPQEKENDKKS